jgi:hypothetical protein
MRMSLVQDVRQSCQARRVLTRLRSLLYDFCRYSHRASSDFSQTCREHVNQRIVARVYALFFVRFSFNVVSDRGLRARERPFYRVVGDEEERCAGCRTDDRAADTAIYAIEASGDSESGARL